MSRVSLSVLGLILLVACSRGPEGTASGDCTDEADNDGNGKVDCEDEGCALEEWCIEQAAKAAAAAQAAAEARAEAAARAQAEQAATAALPYIEHGDLWVQREQNGKDVALNEAQAYCERLELAGQRDWRLPTELEAVSMAKSGKLKPEPYAMWTSTMRGKKRGTIVGITSAAANELGVRYDGQCRARCVRDR
jgi:hypothetical protein